MPAPARSARAVSGCHRRPSAEAKITGAVAPPSDTAPTATQPAGPCATETSPVAPLSAPRVPADSSVQLPFGARCQIAGCPSAVPTARVAAAVAAIEATVTEPRWPG